MMKLLFVLLFIISCTQKYTSYDLIQKVTFNKENFERPITLMKVLPQGNDKLRSCFNQWMFASNAEKNKNDAIPMMIRSLCPGKDYLMMTEMTESWWTTLIFTRACVEMSTKCAELKK